MNCMAKFIILQVVLLTGTIFACPTDLIPVPGISRPAGNITIPLWTMYTFYGNDSYDRDTAGGSPQIREYRWKIIRPDSSYYTYNSPNSGINIEFYQLGQWTVQLEVKDNDLPHWSYEDNNESDGPAYRTINVEDQGHFPPEVKNVKVGTVTSSNADVYGELLDVGQGGGSCTVGVYWGRTEAGREIGSWDDGQQVSSSQTAGEFSETITPSTNFEAGKLYYFRFRAVNNTDGLIDWADIGDPNCYRFVSPPGLPSAPSLLGTNVSVAPTLTWTSGASDYPVCHDVYFGDNETEVSNATRTSPEYKGRFNVPFYVPDVLEPYIPYYYRVEEIVLDPYNGFDERITKSGLASFTTGVSIPIKVNAYPENTAVTLTWGMLNTTGVAGYNVKRFEGTSGYQTINDDLITTSLGYEDTGLVNGNTYYYIVVAVDSSNNESVCSGVVSATPQQDMNQYIFIDDVVGSGDGSIAAPYNTIQAAITNASNEDVIIVRDGTYMGAGNRDIDFGGKLVTLKSENGSESCIINCQGTSLDNHRGFVFQNSENTNSVLEGFTIKNGYAVHGGGIYCNGGSPTLKNCVIYDNHANQNGGGVCINGASPLVIDCQLYSNVANSGGGFYVAGNAQPMVQKCRIFDNSASVGSGFSSYGQLSMLSCLVTENNEDGCYFSGVANAVIVNSTIAGNTNDGAECASSSNAEFVNCIIWDNGGDAIHNLSSTFSFSYCDINGSGGSYDWNDGIGIDGGGNIDTAPLFAEDYHLGVFSPCIDAGDNDAEGVADSNDIDGQSRRLPGWYVDETGNGTSPLVDIGADEWTLSLNESGIPYLTSFEESSGFEVGLPMEIGSSIDGWKAEAGSVSIKEAKYLPAWKDPNDTNDYKYQYLNVSYGSNGSIISREFDPNYPAEIIRVNCIPANGSHIDILNKDDVVASLKFDADLIKVWGYDEVQQQAVYLNTDISYSDVASDCREFLGYIYFNEWNPRPELYFYENTWIEFEIHIDWNAQTYTVLWKHMDAPGGEVIAANQAFVSPCRGFDKIAFTVNESNYGFYVNRISVSNESLPGGIFGENKDLWVQPLEANMDHPIQGHYPIIGNMWYDRLGEYVIKCCPVGEYSDPPKTIIIDDIETIIDPWMIVSSGGNSKKADILGYWDALRFYNGDYYLKIEIYDDLGRLIAEEIKTKTLVYNEGAMSKEVFVEYPLVGKAKGQTYHFEERSDISINWPGSFPFEFKRTYDDNLKNQLYPLFFGWTHNHNIRIIENCSTDWKIDVNGNPISDANGLGVGKLWLCMPLGGQMYQGYVLPEDPTKVKYIPFDMKHLAIDKHRNYIIREVTNIYGTEPNILIDLRYTYYAPDGMKMVFEKTGIELSYGFPENEGVVNWMASIGIKRQEDRFGNALEYTWDANEQFLREISNNQNEMKILLKTYEDDFDWSLPIVRRLQVAAGNETPRDVMYFTIMAGGFIEEGYHCYQWQKVQGDGNDTYYSDMLIRDDTRANSNSMLYNEDGYVVYHNKAGYFSSTFVPASGTTYYLYRDQENTLRTFLSACGSRNPLIDYFERYWYDADVTTGNLIKTTKYYAHPGGSPINESLIYAENCILFKEEITTTCQNGMLIEQKTITHKAQWEPFSQPGTYVAFDPNQCAESYDYLENGLDVAFYVGEGGVRNYNYYYDDVNFPAKPTTIIEWNDIEGDGVNDNIGRTTCYVYNDFGNVIESRTYVDACRFTLANYQYHQLYNFPVTEVSWQGYCQEDAFGVITPSGGRIEKQYLYGDHNGVLGDAGFSGDYLVQVKTLLDSETTPEQWGIDSYYYLQNGQIKAVVDAEDRVTYTDYDIYGYPVCVWQGAILSGSLQNGTAAPQGDPQKRYYYDIFGHKVLEADYLGQVQFSVLDLLGRVIEARIYEDSDAIKLTTNFIPATYDPDVTDADDGSKFKSKELFTDYNYYDSYMGRKLSYGGYELQFKNEVVYYYSFERFISYGVQEGDFHFCYRNDNTIIAQNKTDVTSIPHRYFDVYYFHDSLNRPVHKYEYNYQIWSFPSSNSFKAYPSFSDPYVTHTEYDYYPNGQVKHEKVFKLNRVMDDEGWVVFDEQWRPIFDEPLLLKFEEYEYDVMDRMTKKIIHVVEDDSQDPQIIQIGYDAAGNQIYVMDPKANVIFTNYDNANRKIAEYFATPAILAGGSLDVESTKLNAKLREYTEYYLDNKVKTKTQYDTDGITVLAESVYTYDSRSRIQQVRQIIEDTNENNQMDDPQTDNIAITFYEYADDGSLERVTGESGYHLVIQDAEGKRTGIVLSYHGKPTVIKYPSGDYEEYVYYDYPVSNSNSKFNGLLEEKAVWKDGIRKDPGIRYEYDAYGKIKKVIYPDEGGSLEYAYTSRILGEYGKVKTITDKRHSDDRLGDWGSTYLFEYYPSEQLRSYTDQDGFTFNYDYNTAYNRVGSIEVLNPSDEVIYATAYSYDLAGRMVDVNNITSDPNNPVSIASLDYDVNGNRSGLSYHLDGTPEGPTYDLAYTYSPDNFLRSIIASTSGCDNEAIYGFNVPYTNPIDGLGRLLYAEELISVPNTIEVKSRTYGNEYDMLSQLKRAWFNDIGDQFVDEIFSYEKDGNINQYTRTVEDFLQNPISTTNSYGYTNSGVSDLMAGATGDNPFTLSSDLNGNTTKLPTTSANDTIEYNWDNKLRKAQKTTLEDGLPVTRSIHVKYDPMGNRVYKKVEDITNPSVPVTLKENKYIIDISGELPTILCEIEPSNGSLKKSYFYADGQILSQRVHTDPEDPNVFTSYYYVHDRLGSVRLVVGYNGQSQTVAAVNSYTYTPFGQVYDGQCVETVDNPWQFTGQWHDAEIDQYYLRARMYDPTMMRFTSRDPVRGVPPEPLTLHKYLYVANNSTNEVDPSGESALNIANGIIAASDVYATGLTIAAYGANTGNIDMIILGGFIQQFISPIAYVLGMGGLAGGVCFPAGTEVLTANGEIPIEQIQPGWYVWAADPQTGEPNLFKVIQCLHRETDCLIEITVDDEIIKTTPSHPFYVYGIGWCQANDLEVGMELTDFNGRPVVVDRIGLVLGHQVVYNFEVEESHTYYVSGAKVLVHNSCSAGDRFRRAANTLSEQLTLAEAKGGAGKRIIEAARIKDLKWRGWEKYSHIHVNPDGTKIEVHYMKELMTDILDDFKFK